MLDLTRVAAMLEGDFFDSVLTLTGPATLVTTDEGEVVDGPGVVKWTGVGLIAPGKVERFDAPNVNRDPEEEARSVRVLLPVNLPVDVEVGDMVTVDGVREGRVIHDPRLIGARIRVESKPVVGTFSVATVVEGKVQ